MMRPSIVLPALAILAGLVLVGCNSDGGGGITPDNPPPHITSLDPTYATTDTTTTLELTVHGDGFDQNSIIRWDGEERMTTVLSTPAPEIVLRTFIPADDLETEDTVLVTVFNPPPGGGSSNVIRFGIYDPDHLNPVPTLSDFSPEEIESNHDAMLTVTGTEFLDVTEVIWTPELASSGITVMPMFVSETELTVVISAAQVGLKGSATLRVRNPAPGGGTSGPLMVPVL